MNSLILRFSNLIQSAQTELAQFFEISALRQIFWVALIFTCCFNVFALGAQILRSYKHKKSMSRTMICLMITNGVLWFVYGSLKPDDALFFANLFSFPFLAIVITQSFLYPIDGLSAKHDVPGWMMHIAFFSKLRLNNIVILLTLIAILALTQKYSILEVIQLFAMIVNCMMFVIGIPAQIVEAEQIQHAPSPIVSGAMLIMCSSWMYYAYLGSDWGVLVPQIFAISLFPILLWQAWRFRNEKT